MPFYEYKCSRCAHHHEELQKVTDKPLRKCPECGRATLTRLMSAPVFRLKGGGWYETDFKSDKDRKRNLAGEREPTGDKVADRKGETPPAAAAKPETPPAAAAGTPAAAKSGNGQPDRAAGTARKTTAAAVKRRPARAAGKRKPRGRR